MNQSKSDRDCVSFEQSLERAGDSNLHVGGKAAVGHLLDEGGHRHYTEIDLRASLVLSPNRFCTVDIS